MHEGVRGRVRVGVVWAIVVSEHGVAMVVGCVKGEPRAVCKLGVADGALVER